MKKIVILFDICSLVLLSFLVVFNISSVKAATPQIRVEALVEQIKIYNVAARILDFFPDHKLIEYPSASFTAKVENSGDVDINPSGKIVIKNSFGKVIDVLPLNKVGISLKPQEIQTYYAEWRKTSGIELGYYRAIFDLEFVKGQHLTSQVTFWIMPWKVASVDLFGLILIYELLALLKTLRYTPKGLDAAGHIRR